MKRFKTQKLKRTYLSLFVLISFISQASAEMDKGRLSISVYEKAELLSVFPIFIDKKKYFTNSDGHFTKELAAGTHEIEWQHPHQQKEERQVVQVVSHMDTLILLRLKDEKTEREIIEPKVYNASQEVADGIMLKGLVTSLGDNQMVAGVRVFIKGIQNTALTNHRGEFELMVPKGPTQIILSHAKYNTLTEQLSVDRETSEFLKLALVPKGLEMEDYIVLAPRKAGSVEALMQVRQNSANVADVISAEQMAKSGDGDAAASLKRVTGLTLVDGKYVYVRGLGERYSNTLLNGVAIPSPDPSRRVVPLDLFPTGVIESMVVQKSYSPDRTAEFGGGSILLQLRSFPEKKLMQTSVGQNFFIDSGDDFMTYQGGRLDEWGIDDGTRRLPEGLDGGRIVSGEALQSFKNINNPETGERLSLPNFSFVYGNSYKAKAWRLSHLASFLYGNGRETQRDQSYTYTLTDRQLQEETNNERRRSVETINLGGVLGAGLSYKKKHILQMNYLVARKTTDTTALGEGFDFDFNSQIRETQLQWTERDLRTLIVNGKHEFRSWNKPVLNWHVSHSKARLYEPDERNTMFVKDEISGKYNFVSFAEAIGYMREFADLTENVRDVAFSYVQPITIWGGRKAELEWGVQSVERSRNSEVLRYALGYQGDNLNDHRSVMSKSVEDILNECLNPECLLYEDNSMPTDSYQADQNVISYYMNSRWPLHTDFDVNLGLRYEESVQGVSTFANLAATDEIRFSRLTTRDELPGLSWTWRFFKKMQLRWAYSETVSRPDFKELSDSLWRDDDRDINVMGNPNLRASIISNMDLRWEWYFSRTENISLGFFTKDFQNPIEEISVGASDPVLTYANAEKARNVGVELEFSKNLGFVNSSLSRITLSGNFSHIDSQIFLDNLGSNVNLTTRERPLQGQSPYVINTMLDYNWEKKKTNFSLVYNIFGERISEVGTEGLADVYESPRHQIDFVASHQPWEEASLRFKVSNLLNEDAEFKIGDKVRRTQTRGQALGLSLSVSL